MHSKTFNIPGSDGKNIPVDLYRSSNSDKRPLIIFLHGFKGFKDWGTHHLVAQYFVDHGFDFLKFNFSHNGVSANTGDIFDDLEAFANNTFSKELFDLEKIITLTLSGENFEPPSSLNLIGHSLGGGISILKTAEHKAIDKLVTWASISSFRNLWSPEQEWTWRKDGVLHFVNSRTNQQMPIYSSLLQDLDKNSERLDILSAAQSISKPWLIVHGDRDASIADDHAQELHLQNSQSQLLIIPGADHVFGARHPWTQNSLPAHLTQACDATLGFLKSV
jgi:pimeloyl-ACP methyl ester carboxylesterase